MPRSARRVSHLVSWVAFTFGTLACRYPAVPPAWTQIDLDRPIRAPDVPYEPSSEPAIAAMLQLGRPTANEVVYDLGCGDGRVVIAAVKQSGARGVCVDIDPKLVREAKANATRVGVAERIEFVTQDLFVTDLRAADVVFLFLWPEINRRLLPKLLRELRPGARIVSNMHDMGDFQPDEVITLDTRAKQPHRVYLWTVARVVPTGPSAAEAAGSATGDESVPNDATPPVAPRQAEAPQELANACSLAAECCRRIIVATNAGEAAIEGCAGMYQLPNASCIQPLDTYRRSAKLLEVTCP